MIVLGVHKGHDSSAAIIKDGEIIADVQEERFNRVKHSSDAPINAIQYCLEACGLKNINEVDYVSFSWSNAPKDIEVLFGLEVSRGLKGKLTEGVKKFMGYSELKPPIYYPNLKLKDKSKFIFNEHHLAHAASAYFTRGTNDKCLIFTCDGAGDNVSLAVWLGEGNEIKPLEKFDGFTAGVGWAYSIVTEGLGWIHGDGEGKTMGLAPYGNPDICKGVLDKYFPKFEGRKLVKKSEFGKLSYWEERGSEQYHFDEAYEVAELVKKYGKEHIAAEAQRKIEECLIEYMKGWCKETGIKKIAAAGGVYLNVKLNQRLWEQREDIIIEQHTYPNPADCGLAVGAALLQYYKHHTFKGNKIEHLYLGPSYSNHEIEKILKIRKLKYHFLEDPAMIAAKMLSENKIIAWFQGRMESGPRALGNRSILMSPIHPDNKDTINAFVKFREGFRPFCPSLLYEMADEYLFNYKEELFMITSYTANEKRKHNIPAVVHADGTLRPQMVHRDINPKYWHLINEFGKLSGEYILLNTSFNVMGEPIVTNPKEAIKCFFDSGLDALFLENFVLFKDESVAPKYLAEVFQSAANA
jgi:carbamoyltransferase